MAALVQSCGATPSTSHCDCVTCPEALGIESLSLLLGAALDKRELGHLVDWGNGWLLCHYGRDLAAASCACSLLIAISEL